MTNKMIEIIVLVNSAIDNALDCNFIHNPTAWTMRNWVYEHVNDAPQDFLLGACENIYLPISKFALKASREETEKEISRLFA